MLLKLVSTAVFTLLGSFIILAYEAQAQNIFELLQQNKPVMSTDRMMEVLRGTAPDDAFPTLSEIPATSFSCSDAAGPGFYADTEAQCQVFRRCDIQGTVSSFLCAKGTLFNQLTLT
jgi:Chitin binding Peritrophin-A domain